MVKLAKAIPPTEFSEAFVQHMADRMAVSYFKYGPVAEAYPAKVDALATLQMKLDLYKSGGLVKDKYIAAGNTEYLIDAANYLMIEFMHPKHPNAFFKATDSDGSNGRQWNNGEQNETSHSAEKPLRKWTTRWKGDGD